MIIKTKSTVFNTYADCIVNTINCDGFMGKGLALEFSLRYPKLDQIYQEQAKRKELHTGKIYFYEIDGQKIINFPTKYHFKFPSKYEWIEEGLIHFVSIYKELNIKSVAFPLLGARNGELDPRLVIEIMEKHLKKVDIDVYICYSSELAGKELEMVDAFNKSKLIVLKDCLKLNNPQLQSLIGAQNNIKRFYEIINLPKIGVGTYKKIFNYFYFKKCNEIYIQESLF